VIVVKFGGTSVGTAEAIERTASIVRGRLDRQPVVVVSALGGATNTLLALGEQAGKGHLIGALGAVESLRDRHLEVCSKLLNGCSEESEVSAELSAHFDELASLAEALSVLGHVTGRSLDAIASHGEQLSSFLVAAVFRQRGIPAVHVDAREVMITDENFMSAEPQPEAIAERSREKILPIIKKKKVPVLGGFIGATGKGITTTLGRGGSDYSASLIGAALKSEAIEIWTDVDGSGPMWTACSRPIRELSKTHRSSRKSDSTKHRSWPRLEPRSCIPTPSPRQCGSASPCSSTIRTGLTGREHASPSMLRGAA
jgi:aspartate kinase